MDKFIKAIFKFMLFVIWLICSLKCYVDIALADKLLFTQTSLIIGVVFMVCSYLKR